MTTKVQKKTIEEVRALPKEKKIVPKKPNLFWRTLLKILSSVDLKKTHFQLKKVDMEKLGKSNPALF